MKVCTVCKIEKQNKDFWFNNKTEKFHSWCKSCKYEKSKKYANVSKEQKALYDAKYRDKHYDKLKISKKEEYQRNRDKYIARSLAAQKTPIGRIKHNIRTRINNSIVRRTNTSSILLGCDIETYIEYMEYLFDETMNWDNYGTLWHIDHVRPLCTFDLSLEQEQKEAFHWTNTRPMYASLNLSRSKSANFLEIENHKNLIKNFKCNTSKLRETP